MYLQDELNVHDVFLQPLSDKYFEDANIHIDVLRLDKIHPVVSGNKWFKLKYWLKDALEKNHKTIATFGGAFSNHIIATAYSCNKANINCIGFIRGEEPKKYSQTLLDAKALNMQFEFVSREDFANKENIIQKNNALYFIPEGGYGTTGAKGAEEILQLVPRRLMYNYIVCAVGTGTMLAGIGNASLTNQTCIGISVMKSNFSLKDEVFALLNDDVKTRVQILHNYHFGGYAKFTQLLVNFMNEAWKKFQLPLDFVYTAKALYAVYDLVSKKHFENGSNVLFIHSGGLQGNRSLNENALLYEPLNSSN